MTVETATYIPDLNAALPAGSDVLTEGDNHIKLLKSVLKATFPNVAGQVNATQAELNLLVGAGSLLSAATAGVWTLMRSVTVSGTPSVIEFINGSGGVTISSAYDAYLLDFTDLKSTSGTALLYLQISENAGSSYPANATGCNYSRDDISGTSTITGVSNAAFVIPINVGLPASDPGVSGQILINRPLSAVVRNPFRAECVGGASTMATAGGLIASTTNQFDAVRLTLSASTFAGTNGRVRLYGRRA